MNAYRTLLFGAAAALLAAPQAFGAVFAGTSFEEPGVFPGIWYIDTLDPATDHALLDNPGEPWVNYPAPGDELGFFSWYYNTRDDVGLTDGDYVGVTDYVGDVGAYTDGLQGFEIVGRLGAAQIGLGVETLLPQFQRLERIGLRRDLPLVLGDPVPQSLRRRWPPRPPGGRRFEIALDGTRLAASLGQRGLVLFGHRHGFSSRGEGRLMVYRGRIPGQRHAKWIQR